MRRIFDHDLQVQHLQPDQVDFPLMVFVNRDQVSDIAKMYIPKFIDHTPGAIAPRPLVAISAYDTTQVPFLVRLITGDPKEEIWIPWGACTAELTLMLN